MRLALAFSGGGFRAAGFHFGALKALHELGLLDSVVGLSTVSGGTIVGAAWALSRVKHQPFPEFAREFEAFLAENDLADATLAALAAQPPGAPPSIIRAAAAVYAARLFRFQPADGPERHATLGDLFGARGVPETLSFNATEFHTGIAFRFQQGPGAVKVGNGKLWLDEGDAATLRLADIVAASSCFPGGFEPIVLPDDFVGTDGKPVRVTLRGTHGADRVSLLDGGIYDNQGLGVYLLKRVAEHPDVLIVSDTTQPPPDEGLLPTLRPPGAAGPSLAQVLLATQVLGIGVAVGLFAQAWRGTWFWAGVDGLLGIAVVALLYAGEFLRRRLREFVTDHVDPHHYRGLAHIGVLHLVHLLRARAASVATLTGAVFMRRIRELSMAALHRHKVLGERVCVNGLADPTTARRLASGSLKPASSRVSSDHDLTTRMATTLWWYSAPEATAAAQRAAVIRAGEAGLVANLLGHLTERFPTPDDETQAILERLRTRWNELNR